MNYGFHSKFYITKIMKNLNPFCFIFKKHFLFRNVVTQFITKNVKHFYVHGKCIENHCDARRHWWKTKSFFVHVFSEKFNIRIFRPLHTRVQWAWRLFLLFSLYSKAIHGKGSEFSLLISPSVILLKQFPSSSFTSYSVMG